MCKQLSGDLSAKYCTDGDRWNKLGIYAVIKSSVITVCCKYILITHVLASILLLQKTEISFFSFFLLDKKTSPP
jgi:hypothetical protein